MPDVMNILSTARTPKFDGKETVSWGDVDKSLRAYIRGYNSAKGADLDEGTRVSDLPQTAKTWIANKTLLGEGSAETREDLIFFPVVNPDSDNLNEGALRAVISGRGSQADIPEAAKTSAQNKARGLLEKQFEMEENAERSLMVINTKTAGKFERKVANGRSHIVTDMIALVGDTVMNKILYPDGEVSKSYMQLNNLPAPAGHPNVDGQRVNAYHPMAVNAQNIGAFVKNPTREGKAVHAEFWIDEKIAANTSEGRETISRIENKEEVGMSTGLGLRLVAANGQGEDGRPYTAIGKDFLFDHVAVLLNEKAAGSHVGTAIVNDEGREILIGNVENIDTIDEFRSAVQRAVEQGFGTSDRHVWVRDILIDDNIAIFSMSNGGESRLMKISFERDEDNITLVGDAVEVMEKITFEEVENVNIFAENGAALIKALDSAIDKKVTDDNTKSDVISSMATAAGISSSTVSQILRGEIDIPPEKRIRGFAKALGISFGSLESAVKKDGGRTDNMEFTVENATEYLKEQGLEVVDPAEKEQEGFKDYQENKDEFESFQKEKEDRLAEKRTKLVENSDLEEDDVRDLPEAVIDKMLSTAKVEVDNSGRLGDDLPTSDSGETVTEDEVKDSFEGKSSTEAKEE